MKRILGLVALTVSAAFAQTVTGIVNNYSGINVGSVAQGAIFIVVGTGLSDTSTGLQSVPLQTTLNGVRMEITVGGSTTFAPMYYVLPTQLAGILPSNTPTGTGTLIVRNNGKSSAPASITVTKSGFGVLTTTGTSAARVQDASNGYQELTSTLATNPGNYLVFYGSGVGATAANETVAQTGANASGDLTSIATSVSIGGKPATVLYRGRTAFPGLDQINVQVPALDTNSYSCAVGVVITTNNVAANSTTIPVAASGTTCSTGSTGGGGGGGGGSTAGTSFTQSEIDRFIAAGSYSAGSISLNRTTSYAVDLLTNSQSITKQDSLSASFSRVSGADLPNVLRGIIPAGYPTAVIGGCSVFNYNAFTTNPYPNYVVTALDAGTPLTSVGPNGTQTMARGSGLSYSATSIPNTYLAAGRYTLSGPGGPQVGAFSGTLDTVADFTLTNPTSFSTINRNSGLNVAWTGGDSRSYATIEGLSFTSTGTTTGGAGFICVIPVSQGSFTVPPGILQQLPASTSIQGFTIRGIFTVAVGGFGARFTPPSGLDVLTANNFWSWTFASQFN